MAPKTTLTNTMKRETKSRKRRKRGRKEKRVGFCEMDFNILFVLKLDFFRL